MYTPLADRLRPNSLDEVAGQTHLIGEGRALRNIINSGIIPNMIFYGPSGIGKTTIANIIANATNRRLYKMNGTTASISDIKAIIEELDTFLTPDGVLLYLDEIQYFNKKQQQTLLEFIENGKITLIASTAENPYFYVYNAILSRSTIFEFKPIEVNDIKKAIIRAVQFRENELNFKINLSNEVLDLIAHSCGGDVRKAINAIEILTLAVSNDFTITEQMAKEVSQRSSMRYDRDGDVHYDILSAFQKSIRGSDENAALHYLARLVEAGDLPSICRRLLVISAEDIGLAYPQAIMVVKACVDSALQLGFPEARIPLAQAVVLLATSPKSNSAYFAIDQAIEDIRKGNSGDIPVSLKDTHYAGAKKLGRGNNYLYPHSYENNYVKQQYLPDNIKNVKYYEYGENKFEQANKKYWENIKKNEK